MVLEAFKINTGPIGLRFFDWLSVPIIIAVFIAANDYILKLKDYSTLVKGFAIFTLITFLIPLIQIDSIMLSSYFRMFVAIEINIVSFYGFFKTKNFSFLVFILSIMSLSIGGMSFLVQEYNLAIFSNAIGLILLGLIFFIPQRKKMGISKYFSIEEKLKDTKKALSESESRYQRIFNAAKDAFLIFDLQGNIVDANKKAFNMYEYKENEFLNLSGRDIVHPNYKNLFEKFKQDVIKHGEFYTESVDVKKDGTPFYVDVRGTDIEYNGKKHLLAIVRDVSYRKKAENQLKNSRRQLSTLMNNLPGMAYQCLPDDKWTMKYVSKGCEDLTGYPAYKLIGNKEVSYASLIHPDDRRYVNQMVTKSIDSNQPFEITYRIHTATGKQKWVWEQGVGLFSDEGKIIDLEGFITDITAWKKSDEELKKLSNFANDYVELPFDVNLYEDLGHKIKSLIGSGIIGVNRIENDNTMFIESIVGISEKKLAFINRLLGSKRLKEPIPNIPEDTKHLLTKGSLVKVPGGVRGLFFNRIPKTISNSLEKMMNIQQIYSIGLRHETQLFGNVVIILTDKTRINKDAIEAVVNQAAVVLDKRKAWEELQEAHEKIQTMNLHLEKKVKQRTKRINQLLKQKDEFINQLGHDLKNPLGPLISLIPIIEKHTTNPRDKQILQVINRNVEYMKNLVQKTLELARLNSPNTSLTKTMFSLKKLILQLVSQNKYLFEEKQIRIETHIPTDLIIDADKIRIEELVNNLINNAVKYNKKNGYVIISADETEERTTISIEDSGIGMSEEQINHVFDEFYKADPSRHDFDSSGLGMSICKRIIDKHGGDIWVTSDGPGKGSTFYFSIPKRSAEKIDTYKKEHTTKNIHQKIDMLFQKIS